MIKTHSHYKMAMGLFLVKLLNFRRWFKYGLSPLKSNYSPLFWRALKK